MKTLKRIPEFGSEAEERKFWETHDSTDYVDWSKANHAYSKTTPITEENDNSSDPTRHSR